MPVVGTVVLVAWPACGCLTQVLQVLYVLTAALVAGVASLLQQVFLRAACVA